MIPAAGRFFMLGVVGLLLAFRAGGQPAVHVPPTRPTPLATTRFNDVAYVDLADAAVRLGLKIFPGETARKVTLVGPGTKVDLAAESREAAVNGLRLFLGNPVLLRGGLFYVGKVDFERGLTPILRPALAGPLPARPRVIALDPGHGGVDNGMENKALGLQEKILTLDVALRAKKLLEADGYKVVLTREDDRQLGPDKVTDFKNRGIIANQAKADLLVSIHFNSLYPDTKTSGTEVYTFTRSGQRSDQSWSFAEANDAEPDASPVNAFDPWSSLLGYVMHREVIGHLKTLRPRAKNQAPRGAARLELPGRAGGVRVSFQRGRGPPRRHPGISRANCRGHCRRRPRLRRHPRRIAPGGEQTGRNPCTCACVRRENLSMKIIPSLRLAGLALLVASRFVTSLHAWGAPGHRMVNELALASLPADFPAFVHEPAAAERIAFLSGVPDRWRNVEPLLKQSGGSWTDHFIDLEQLADAGIDFSTVSPFRDDFVVAFAAGRAAHADKFPAIDPTKDSDHTKEWPGFAPWAISECYGRLRSACGYYKVLKELGTPEEVANAEADIVYTMGILGHYVGDSAQPLHTTIHHDGWVGPNPNGYTEAKGFHPWIDSGLIAKAGTTTASLMGHVTPAQPISLANRADGRDPLFAAILDYILASNKLVEPLYQLEKAGKLGNDNVTKTADGKEVRERRPLTKEGREFVEGRLLTGGEMLGALWLTAWRDAPPDTYLRSELVRRQAKSAPKP